MFGPIFYDFVTLIAIINPVEAAAAFATLTGSFGPKQKATIALRSSIVATLILLGFGFVGEALLNAIGVGFPAFRIAGGLLLLRVGFNMVFAKETGTQRLDEDEQEAAAQSDDPSVFPLAIPIITGPGALTTIVAILSKKDQTPFEIGAVVVVVLVVMAITFVSMRASSAVTRVLGPTGVNAVGRIMGVLVSAIAIQLVLDGVEEFFPAFTK